MAQRGRSFLQSFFAIRIRCLERDMDHGFHRLVAWEKLRFSWFDPGVVPSFGINPEKNGINPGNQRYNRHLLYSFAWIYVIYVHDLCTCPRLLSLPVSRHHWGFWARWAPKTRHTKKNHSWSFKLKDYECQYGVSIESISSSSKNEWVSFPATLW